MRPAETWTAVLAVVFGLLLAADYGVLAMGHYTIAPQTPAEWAKSWKCPVEELAEERVSLAECHAMAARIEGTIVARPTWFRPSEIAIGILGVIAALGSAIAAIGLIDARRWARAAFVSSLAALIMLEAAQLVLVSNTGPVLRSDYLWKYLPWLLIHVALLTWLAPYKAPAIPGPPPAAGHSAAASALHLPLAAAIFFLYAESWWFMAVPWGKLRGFPTQLHKNIGLSVLVIAVVLLYLRLRSRVPAPLDGGPRWMRRLALADHVLMYAVVLLACVSGYLSSVFSGWTTSFWWVVDLPSWGWEDEELNELFSDVHVFSTWALLALLVTHIAGALHHALRNDGVVRRMLHW